MTDSAGVMGRPVMKGGRAMNGNGQMDLGAIVSYDRSRGDE